MIIIKADVKTMLELRKLKIFVNDEEISALDYIEKLEDIIKNIGTTLEDNYGGLPIIEYERLINLCKGSDKIE